VTLHRVARRTLDVRGGRAVLGVDADDVIAEAFVAVMKKGVSRVISLRAYLCQVVRNKAVDAVRARLRERHLEGADVDSPVVENAEERAVLALRNEEIRAHLGILTEQQRRAVTERVLRGRPTNEVARELGVSGPRIAALVRQAMQKIKALMVDDQAAVRRIDEEEGGAT